MKINIKLLNDNAKIPKRGSRFAAGYDLYANLDDSIVIPPGENNMIHTGIAIDLPRGYFGGIFARSGLASRQGLRPANCTAVIDEDYVGEIMVCLYNDSPVDQMICPGDRIAQLVVIPFLPLSFEVVDELRPTERGERGFGSTGK